MIYQYIYLIYISLSDSISDISLALFPGCRKTLS